MLVENHIEQVCDLADPQEAIKLLELLISIPNQEIDNYLSKYPSKSAFFLRQVFTEDKRRHWEMDTEDLNDKQLPTLVRAHSAFTQVRTGMLKVYPALQTGDIRLATFKLINDKIEELKVTVAAREQAKKQLRDKAKEAEQQLQNYMAASDKQLQALKAEHEKRLQDLQAEKEKIIQDLQRENSKLKSDVAAAVVARDKEGVLNLRLNDTLKIPSETKPRHSSQNQELRPPSPPRSPSPLREHSLFRETYFEDYDNYKQFSMYKSQHKAWTENNSKLKVSSANNSLQGVCSENDTPRIVSSAHDSPTCVSSAIELPHRESSAINVSTNCQVNQEDDATPRTETTDERRFGPQ